MKIFTFGGHYSYLNKFQPLLQVICLEEQAFHELLDRVVERLMAQREEKPEWLSGEDAMKMLNITSKTTLQKLKNEGYLKFSQPMKKVTLFSRQSILDYLERHSQEPFQ